MLHSTIEELMSEEKPRYEDIIGTDNIRGIVAIEDLLKIFPNRYVVTEIIAKRANDLESRLDLPRVDLGDKDLQEVGYVQVAIAEFLAGQIKPKIPDEAFVPKNQFPDDYEKIPSNEI